MPLSYALSFRVAAFAALLASSPASADMDCEFETAGDGNVYNICLADGQYECFVCQTQSMNNCRQVPCPPKPWTVLPER